MQVIQICVKFYNVARASTAGTVRLVVLVAGRACWEGHPLLWTAFLSSAVGWTFCLRRAEAMCSRHRASPVCFAEQAEMACAVRAGQSGPGMAAPGLFSPFFLLVKGPGEDGQWK